MKSKLNISDIKEKADMGDVDSQYQLAFIYDMGIGVTKDYELAFSYYSKASEQNHAKAQYNLAICYALAKGVAKDINHSKTLILLARDNGYSGGSGF